MSPPELPGDIPVTNVLEPVDVDRFPALGEDSNAAVMNRLQSWRCQRLHLHKPLIRKARLHDGVAAIAMTHGVRMRFNLDERVEMLEHLHDSFACLKAIDAKKLRGHA